MVRIIPTLACVALAFVSLTACRSRQTHERMTQVNSGALIVKGDLLSSHTIRSEYDGKVGYLKVYPVREAGGPVFPWKYVYDLDWNELGWVDQFGTAYTYHRYAKFQQQIHKTTLRIDRMPADSTENNVMRMLKLDVTRDNVTFPVATVNDIIE